MPQYKIHVKWGKEKFNDVEVDTDEPPEVLKAQLFALSNVPPDRQKVMVKGSTLKDDTWGVVKLKDGMTLLMMGSADALPQEPALKTRFIEDMNDSERAQALEMPLGLINLGNTCYLNATLQCLRSCPEFCSALREYRVPSNPGASASSAVAVTTGVRDLFAMMDVAGEPVRPLLLLAVLHRCFPLFAERGEQGELQQQDANEAWVQIVRCLQVTTRYRIPKYCVTLLCFNPNITIFYDRQEEVKSGDSGKSFVDQFMSCELERKWECLESKEEPITTSTEKQFQISCYIDKEVKYLHSGVMNSLSETISKASAVLGRDAQWKRSDRLSRLPAYLTVQFVRFFYKEKEAVNAKILKEIKFPMALDMIDACSDSLRERLAPQRQRFKELDDARTARRKQGASSGAADAANGVTAATNVGKVSQGSAEPYWFPDDPGSNNSGLYELQAVLTHKGRSSNSGHYVAWVRRKGDEWLMFDDDNVSPIQADDIERLAGGGDWHIAYILLYAPRVYTSL